MSTVVYVPRALGGTLILTVSPPQPPQYINVTWKTRDLQATWKTRDEQAAWKTRDEQDTWKTRS